MAVVELTRRSGRNCGKDPEAILASHSLNGDDEQTSAFVYRPQRFDPVVLPKNRGTQ